MQQTRKTCQKCKAVLPALDPYRCPACGYRLRLPEPFNWWPMTVPFIILALLFLIAAR